MEIDNYFATRCTVRNYTDREIEPKLLTKLLEEAAHAPNTGNMQLYSVIVSRTSDEKAALAPQHFNQPCVTGCNVLLTFCIDIHRFRRWCEVNDAEEGFGNMQMLLAAAIDTSLFAQQFNTLAELHGLGCCYLGTTAYNAPAIAEMLACPSGVVPLISLAVGYPKGDGKRSDRLPIGAIVHYGKYDDYDDSRTSQYMRKRRVRKKMPRLLRKTERLLLRRFMPKCVTPRQPMNCFRRI